jgi:hypothetical protein
LGQPYFFDAHEVVSTRSVKMAMIGAKRLNVENSCIRFDCVVKARLTLYEDTKIIITQISKKYVVPDCISLFYSGIVFTLQVDK